MIGSGAGRQGGTGLGLAIVRDLVRSHGGTIDLVRTGKEGALFRIALPAHASIDSSAVNHHG